MTPEWKELVMTLAKLTLLRISDTTPRADDHVDFQALDDAIKRVEKSEAGPPPYNFVRTAPDDTNRPACRYPIGDAAS